MSIDKKIKTEKVVKNSNHSQQKTKYIVTKKFPISVQYKTPLWDNDSKLYTNELENKSLQVGIVFTPKKLTENSFELHDSKGKICTYYFKENSLLDYCEVFTGDSIKVEYELVETNNN